jgi:hypothetical protein
MSRFARRAFSATVAVVLVGALAGCSVDAVIWGPEGAGVIDAAERVIAAGAAGDTDGLSCESADVDFGEPSDWEGLSAGEPERFNPDYWPALVALEPTWNINLELDSERVAAGLVFPGDVFFGENGDDLCVADIAWPTIESVG